MIEDLESGKTYSCLRCACDKTQSKDCFTIPHTCGKECNCKEMSCDKTCSKRHTCKIFTCESCKEMYTWGSYDAVSPLRT